MKWLGNSGKELGKVRELGSWADGREAVLGR